VKKEKVPKGPGCVETLSSGLDLNARDARGINADINVSAPYSYEYLITQLRPMGDRDLCRSAANRLFSNY
jgi:hypothetical protein